MRIIFYSVAESFGGGERYLTLLIQELRARGIESYVVCASSSAPASIKALCCSSFMESPSDVIVLNGVGALYRWGRNLPRCAASIFVHHSLLSDHQSIFIKRWLRPMLVRYYAQRITTIVRVCRAAISDSFFANIETVHNGVPFSPALAPVRRNGPEFRLAMLGAVNANKGQDEAIRMLTELPKHIYLRIIGDGPLRVRLMNLCRTSGVSSRVEWTGFVADPIRHLAGCQALLVLSKDEALPYAALEAMAYGLPVISTPVGGMPELIIDGYNGYLSDRTDSAGLLRNIVRLDEEEDLRFKMAQNARQTISESFNVNVMASTFIRVCEAAIARRSSK